MSGNKLPISLYLPRSDGDSSDQPKRKRVRREISPSSKEGREITSSSKGGREITSSSKGGREIASSSKGGAASRQKRAPSPRGGARSTARPAPPLCCKWEGMLGDLDAHLEVTLLGPP